MADPKTMPSDSLSVTSRPANPGQYIAAWADLTDACEQFLLAGLRREIGPDGDLKAAYGKWYAERMQQHDQAMLRMMAEFERRGGGCAR
jgi:hypothetical protein